MKPEERHAIPREDRSHQLVNTAIRRETTPSESKQTHRHTAFANRRSGENAQCNNKLQWHRRFLAASSPSLHLSANAAITSARATMLHRRGAHERGMPSCRHSQINSPPRPTKTRTHNTLTYSPFIHSSILPQNFAPTAFLAESVRTLQEAQSTGGKQSVVSSLVRLQNSKSNKSVPANEALLSVNVTEL